VQEQNDLTRQFTLIMSLGVVASLLVGVVMDHSGVEAATACTIALALLYNLLLLVVSAQQPPSTAVLYTGFVVYVMFRQFLFPVSIALQTARLGFKYFGLLNGISSLVAGIIQLLMATVVRFAQGTCHRYSSGDVPLMTDACDHGRWQLLHVGQCFVLIALLLVPVLDRRERLLQAERVREIVRVRSSWNILYGGASPLLTKNRYATINNSPRIRWSRNQRSSATTSTSHSMSPFRGDSSNYDSIRSGRDDELEAVDEDEGGIVF
jgi:hypothetical protein